jgi:16S rRNA (cytosine967-C5)-methyltransferase
MRGYYDRVLSLVIDRDFSPLDPEVLDACGSGATSCSRCGSPPRRRRGVRRLVASAGKGSAKGFANGVLRTLTRSTPEEWRDARWRACSGDDRLAVEYAHPAGWWPRFVRRSPPRARRTNSRAARAPTTTRPR